MQSSHKVHHNYSWPVLHQVVFACQLSKKISYDNGECMWSKKRMLSTETEILSWVKSLRSGIAEKSIIFCQLSITDGKE